MAVGLNYSAVNEVSDTASVLNKEFLNTQATTECRFTLKHLCGMIKTKFSHNPDHISLEL